MAAGALSRMLKPLFAFAAVLGASPWLAASQPALEPAALPLVEITRDNTVLSGPCRVAIAPGAIITDADGDGVVHIEFDDGEVVFEPGAILRGSAPAPTAMPDQYAGVGIRVRARSRVTIRAARVEGFKVGIHATQADQLTLVGCAFIDNWRQRLRSTPEAEDQADWLWPHANDNGEWIRNYGAGVCIERSRGVTVRECVVRAGQNGLLLDRVTDSSVFDNDFSFLSGWGLALWRSTGNMVTSNAFDFCIRGYSHGVYNRGQDSAGILCFEQSSGNVFAHNSATHSGDGFFSFAGKEALGESPASPAPDFNFTRRGCNDNLLIQNDFSYSAAHGVEITFSFGNQLIGNRLIENAICGFWGGYSQQTLVAGNTFSGNGLPGAREGGGINVEHGAANRYIKNDFSTNTVDIALWARDNPALHATPWAKANHRGSNSNEIAGNLFAGPGPNITLVNDRGLSMRSNTTAGSGPPILKAQDSPLAPAAADAGPVTFAIPAYRLLGASRPVAARAELAGRQSIIMGPWGPWDHRSPLIRPAGDDGFRRRYDLYRLPDGELSVEVEAGQETVEVRVEPPQSEEPSGKTLSLTAVSTTPGVHAYAVRVRIGEVDELLSGRLVNCAWNVWFFPAPLSPEGQPIDPRREPGAWRSPEPPENATLVQMGRLKLPFGMRGASQLGLSDELAERRLPADHFGTIAETVIPLAPGRWRISTLSDDGVRVRVSTSPLVGAGPEAPPGAGPQAPLEQTVIDNWTHHGPTRDRGEFTVPGEAPMLVPVAIRVEHFELDGYAVLELALEPAHAP